MPFSQILNHREAFHELVLKRQIGLLRATGLKLFSHFGVLPSGEILGDGGLDSFLSEQMFDEEFEFTVADASSVGASTLRCSLGRNEFRPFGISKPANLATFSPDKRVMRKMNTFNLGDHLQQVGDFDTNYLQEKSQMSSKASLPRGDQESSFILFAGEDGPECSPFKMRGFEEQGKFTLTTTTQSNRSIPNSSQQKGVSPAKKDQRFLGGLNRIEKQPSVIKEEDPVDSISAHHSSNGAASKPQGSAYDPHVTSEMSKRSNSKTDPPPFAVTTTLQQISKATEAKLFSDQSIKVNSKHSQTHDVCLNPTLVEESLQQHFDSLANNDSAMNHSSIPHIRLSNNTMSDSSRMAIKHDESIVNCAELDRAEGIEMVLGYQTNLEPEAGPDTPIAQGEGRTPGGDLETFSRFRSEKLPLNPQSYFEKQRSTENPESSERLSKHPVPLFEVKVGYNRYIQSEIDEIENKIQLYKQREKQLDETLHANHISQLAQRSPDQVQSELVFELDDSKPSESTVQHRKDEHRKHEHRKPLPVIPKAEEFNLLFGSMYSSKEAEKKKPKEPRSEPLKLVQNPTVKFSPITSQVQLQTPVSKIEKITNELRNSIKRHSLNKTSLPVSEFLKEEKSERVNLNNLSKIQPVKQFDLDLGKQALQSHYKNSASKPPSPSSYQANTKKSANSTKTSDFYKLSMQFGKHHGTPTNIIDKAQDFLLKNAVIASKLENSSVSHVAKNISLEPPRVLVSNLIKSSHEIEVKRLHPKQSETAKEEVPGARLIPREDRKVQPKSKTVYRRENRSSQDKTNSQVFLYSSVNNPLKKQTKESKLTQSTHVNNSTITSKLLKSAIDLQTEKPGFGVDFSVAKRSRQSVEPETPPHLQKLTQPLANKLATSVAGNQKHFQASKPNFSSALAHELQKTLHSTVPGVSEKVLQAVHKKYTANQAIKKSSVDYSALAKKQQKQ